MSQTAYVWWSVLIWFLALVLSTGGGTGVVSAVLWLAGRGRNGNSLLRRRAPARGLTTPAAGGLPPVPPPPGSPPAPSQAVTPPPVPPPPVPSPPGEATDVLRGGTWIGILERIAITACLLLGYPAGIAFVIAIKGLGRYPELREHPSASELFVIGTLSSMIWAVAVGVVGRMVLNTL